MYNIADKMITGCKLDFAILTLQIPIACFDMCSPQVCVFTTFHVVISEKESVELFYKVRNG